MATAAATSKLKHQTAMATATTTSKLRESATAVETAATATTTATTTTAKTIKQIREFQQRALPLLTLELWEFRLCCCVVTDQGSAN